jgi:hypothetical protein
MSSVVISGDSSGAITLAAPSVAGTNTITLPASTGTVLTTGSPQSGGVIQVVSRTSSQSYDLTASGGGGLVGPTQLTDYYVTITPKFSTSKILVIVTMTSVGFANTSGNNNVLHSFLYRGTGTSLSSICTYGYNNTYTAPSLSYLDSPATTSATTYYIYGAGGNSTSGSYSWNRIAYSNNGTTITALEIAA